MRLGSPLHTASTPLHRMLLRVGLALGPALVAGMACGADPDVVWSGEHLDYATDPERAQTLCAGTYHLQDRFVGTLADIVGVRLRRRNRILYTYLGLEEVAERCSPGIDPIGCVKERVKVYSMRPTHRHELVHTVTIAGRWSGPRAFEEGFAEALGSSTPMHQRRPIAEVLETFDYGLEQYYTMGLFVRFLLERHGLAAFAGFMQTAGFRDTPAEYAEVFASHFGETLKAASAAFDEFPECSRWNNRIPILECAHTEPWDGERLRLRVEVQCSSPEVQGPTPDERARISTTRAFEIPEAGEYRFSSTSAVTIGLRLSPCGSCADPRETSLFDTASEPTLPLDPGRYYLTFYTRLGEEATVDLEISRLR